MQKLLTICVTAGMLLSGMAGTIQAEDWEIYMTVDNQYDVYFGTPTATNFHAGGDTYVGADVGPGRQAARHEVHYPGPQLCKPVPGYNRQLQGACLLTK